MLFKCPIVGFYRLAEKHIIQHARIMLLAGPKVNGLKLCESLHILCSHSLNA